MLSDVRPSASPVLVAFDAPAKQRRYTVAGRPLLVVPHLVALVVAGPAVLVVLGVGWFWALVVGRLPQFAAVILAGYLSWQTRVLAYLLLLTDTYPPFSLGDAGYPVRVTARPGRLNRWSVLLRLVLALPALLVVSTATLGLGTFVLLVAWVSAAVNGRLPTSLHQGFAGFVRYETRLAGYLTMVTSEYPWGLLGDPDIETPDSFSAFSGPAVWVGEGPVRQPVPPSPTRDPYWRLVLSPAAKNNIVLFIVVGVASVVALNIATTVSRYNRIRTDEAATAQVQSAYHALSTSVLLYQGQTRSCANTADPLTCLTQAAQTVSEAFTVFVRQVNTTTMPSSAGAAERLLASDGSHAEADFAQLSTSTSAGHYQLIIESSDLPRLLTHFDQDYQALGARLTSLG